MVSENERQLNPGKRESVRMKLKITFFEFIWYKKGEKETLAGFQNSVIIPITIK